MNSSFFFISSCCNSSFSLHHPAAKQLERQGIAVILSLKQMRRPLLSLLYTYILLLPPLSSSLVYQLAFTMLSRPITKPNQIEKTKIFLPSKFPRGRDDDTRGKHGFHYRRCLGYFEKKDKIYVFCNCV